MNDFFNFIGNNLVDFWQYTGFANATWGHIVMILVGCLFITLAIKKGWEPLLLVPIGFGIILGNIPFKADAGLDIGFTLIGMHLKKVAVPLRLTNNTIGEAMVLAARTRPKFIGGARAVYDEEML